MSNIEKPIIHMNGDSPKELTEQYSNAANAVDDAIAAIANTFPHLRNYYVSRDPQSGDRAREQHDSRCSRLIAVRKELRELAEHCFSYVK